jgi:hypothetical protein
MAGTMPHAIFIETGLDGGGSVAAYAAELPGCAVFAGSDAEAVAAMPRRAAAFTDWLRSNREEAPEFIGDNWYEVERASAQPNLRAAFSLDELPPSASEFAAYLRWLELAREQVADAIDAAGEGTADEALFAVVRQDHAFATELGSAQAPAAGEVIDQLFAARDALTGALEAAGPAAEDVRRILRIAIADDLRLAERLRDGPS